MSLRSIMKRNWEAKHGVLPASSPRKGKVTVGKALPIVATAAPAKSAPAPKIPEKPCALRGKVPIRTEECGGCRKKTQLKVFACSEFGACTIAKRVPGVAGCCKGCTRYQSEDATTSHM
jgi:hypothetical protein